MVCGSCGEAVVPLTLYDHNQKRMEAALAGTAAAVSRGLLKRLRETYDLSQRDASRLFGAGEAAFAKWESGQSEMSDPAALLVQCAISVPGVMEHLASLAGMQLRSPLQWHEAKQNGSVGGRSAQLHASAEVLPTPESAGARNRAGPRTPDTTKAPKGPCPTTSAAR
jgi:putative zinc finger/helix-turn-helix YgiT family protein